MTGKLLKSARLYCPETLGPGQMVELTRAQAHYAGNVMRLKAAMALRLFNGCDGEWLVQIETLTRKACTVRCLEALRAPDTLRDIDYLFAPLKSARLDYMVQKATEMGVARLRPVLSDYTNVARVNTARMRANTIEAAEQCNLVGLPQVMEPEKLARAIENHDGARALIFCDEAAGPHNPLSALAALKADGPVPLAVLIGPEGGFSPREREMLLAQPFTTAISLGPRIMRADTAGVAALALVQAVLGDWQA